MLADKLACRWLWIRNIGLISHAFSVRSECNNIMLVTAVYWDWCIWIYQSRRSPERNLERANPESTYPKLKKICGTSSNMEKYINGFKPIKLKHFWVSTANKKIEHETTQFGCHAGTQTGTAQPLCHSTTPLSKSSWVSTPRIYTRQALQMADIWRHRVLVRAHYNGALEI